MVILSIAGLLLLSLFLFRRETPEKPVFENAGSRMAEMGRYLFFDNRLSYNNSKSCGSCHDPKFAFTDGYRKSTTANGENVKHNAPSLINIAFHNYFDWANPGVTTLEKQHERPLFNESPVELGAKGNEKLILSRIGSDPLYQRLFAQSFPLEKKPLNFSNIIRAIASFVSSLQSFNSPYDRFIKGDSNALSASSKAGMSLFFSNRLKCGSCHRPPLFTTANISKNADSIYFNTGLYNVANNNKYPGDDNGLFAYTNDPADDGKFKTPSLRNVSATAPYMHDGSINTLEEVIDMYRRGGRLVTTGPNAGDGSRNLLKNKAVSGFTLSSKERNDLLGFLFSLTDSSVFANPQFQNPFNISNK